LCRFIASEERFITIAIDCYYSQGKVRRASFNHQLRGYWERLLAFAAYVQSVGKILRSRISVIFAFESFMFALVVYFYRTFNIHCFYFNTFSLA
jgi:hypothetical protein